MSEKQFIIRETVDDKGHRVIVYEFPEADSTPGKKPLGGRHRRMPASSFIKVTFESPRSGSAAEGRNRLPDEGPSAGDRRS